MNPILYLIYQFLKGVTLTAFRIYYPNTTKLNVARLRYKRPSILVSNHPNTLLDPLNAAKEVPMVVHFLANASLFQGKFQSWFFNTFFCIPIERPQDTKGKPINNRHAFARCDEFLGSGGCLFIAPEGGSDMERRLRPIKTGTARIALSAEARQDFKLGLTIQPVGLTYDAPNYFHSRVTLNAGAPIQVQEYQEAYQQDPIGTVRRLTAELEERMRGLIIDTKDEEEHLLVKRLETILRHSKPVPEAQHFARTKHLIKELREWQSSQPEAFDQFQKQVNAYFHSLSQQGTTDEALARPGSTSLYVLKLLLGLPLFIYGFLNNLIPTGIALFITRKLNLYVGYNSSVKILAGLIFFPLFYVLQSWLVGVFMGTTTAIVYFLSLFPAGWFAWRWWQWLRKWKAILHLDRERKTLESARAEIMKSLLKLVA